MNRLIRAQFGEGDRNEAEAHLADLFGSTLGVADMLGRRRLLLELDAKLGARHGLHGTAPKVAGPPSTSVMWSPEHHAMGVAFSAARAYGVADAARALVSRLKRAGSVAVSALSSVEGRVLALLVARGLATADANRAELARRVWDMPWEVVLPLLMRESRREYRDNVWEQRTRDWRKTLADYVLTVTVNDAGSWWAIYEKGSGRLLKQARGTSTPDAMQQADGFVKSLARTVVRSDARYVSVSDPYGIGRARGRQAARASHPDETSYGPRREDVDALKKTLGYPPMQEQVPDFERGYLDGWREQRAAMGLRPLVRAADDHSDLHESVRYAASWWAKQAGARALFYAAKDAEQSVIPRVTFEEAVADLAGRTARWGPRLTANAKKVSALYAREHVFALAKSTSLKVTERVQKLLSEALAKGRPQVKVVDAITKLGDWSKSYSVLVYRNALATAYSAGRHAQAQDPDVKAYAPAYRYTSVCDVDARPEHCAMDGAIGATDDPMWHKFSPPTGHQCRCALELVDRDELKRLRLIDKTGKVKSWIPAKARGFISAGAFPDKGFGMGRPDLRLHGVRAL